MIKRREPFDTTDISSWTCLFILEVFPSLPLSLSVFLCVYLSVPLCVCMTLSVYLTLFVAHLTVSICLSVFLSLLLSSSFTFLAVLCMSTGTDTPFIDSVSVWQQKAFTPALHRQKSAPLDFFDTSGLKGHRACLHTLHALSLAHCPPLFLVDIIDWLINDESILSEELIGRMNTALLVSCILIGG